MSIIIGGGRSRRWATLASILLMGVVLVFAIPYVAQLLIWAAATYVNATCVLRLASAEAMNKTVTVTTVTIRSEFGNYTVLIAEPVNSPFNQSVWSYTRWALTTLLRLLSEPAVWAAVVGLTLIATALAMKET